MASPLQRLREVRRRYRKIESRSPLWRELLTITDLLVQDYEVRTATIDYVEAVETTQEELSDISELDLEPDAESDSGFASSDPGEDPAPPAASPAVLGGWSVGLKQADGDAELLARSESERAISKKQKKKKLDEAVVRRRAAEILSPRPPRSPSATVSPQTAEALRRAAKSPEPAPSFEVNLIIRD